MAATKKIEQPVRKADRVDLRLYNTIIIYDVYCIARTADEARQAILQSIQGDVRMFTEATSRELTSINSIRASWAEQSPFVAADVSDEEFENLKGITTSAAFERLYQRR